jgi:protein-ribulosamine 3-kinase
MPTVHSAILRTIQNDEPGVTVDQKGAYVQSSSGRAYIAKIGSPSETEQFIGEAKALQAMHTAAPGIAPRLIGCGVLDEVLAEHDSELGRPYFVSEYKHMSSLTAASAKKLAKKLSSEMHQYKSTSGFGFDVPTFCGRTKQDNGWYKTWGECYDALIGGLLSKLEVRGGFQDICHQGQQIRERSVVVDCPRDSNQSTYRVIPALLGSLDIEPVLLHGDLWVSVRVTCQ